MAEPLTTITAGAIFSLVLQKFLDTSANSLAKKLSEASLEKLDMLYKKICSKLKGQSTELDDDLNKLNIGENVSSPDMIVKHLNEAMQNHPEFAIEIQEIAHEITIELEQLQDNSQMTQVNYGGTNYQTKTGNDNTNFFGGTHNHN